MGNTIKKLASGKLDNHCIFNNRMVVEICEKVHMHYRNLRITLSMRDFIEFAGGILNASARWANLGRPDPEKGKHVELCRRAVAKMPHNDEIQINLNTNLYKKNEGRIYAEGAELADKTYIHVKIRDLRLELTHKEFKEVANAFRQAEEGLESSDTAALL